MVVDFLGRVPLVDYGNGEAERRPQGGYFGGHFDIDCVAQILLHLLNNYVFRRIDFIVRDNATDSTRVTTRNIAMRSILRRDCFMTNNAGHYPAASETPSHEFRAGLVAYLRYHPKLWRKQGGHPTDNVTVLRSPSSCQAFSATSDVLAKFPRKPSSSPLSRLQRLPKGWSGSTIELRP